MTDLRTAIATILLLALGTPVGPQEGPEARLRSCWFKAEDGDGKVHGHLLLVHVSGETGYLAGPAPWPRNANGTPVQLKVSWESAGYPGKPVPVEWIPQPIYMALGSWAWYRIRGKGLPAPAPLALLPKLPGASKCVLVGVSTDPHEVLKPSEAVLTEVRGYDGTKNGDFQISHPAIERIRWGAVIGSDGSLIGVGTFDAGSVGAALRLAAWDLRAWFESHPRRATFQLEGGSKVGQRMVRCYLWSEDLEGRQEAMWLCMAPKGPGYKSDPEPDGSWGPAQGGMKEYPLGSTAPGFQRMGDAYPEGTGTAEYVLQLKVKFKDGKFRYTPPVILTVAFSSPVPPQPPPPGRDPARLEAAKSGKPLPLDVSALQAEHQDSGAKVRIIQLPFTYLSGKGLLSKDGDCAFFANQNGMVKVTLPELRAVAELPFDPEQWGSMTVYDRCREGVVLAWEKQVSERETRQGRQVEVYKLKTRIHIVSEGTLEVKRQVTLEGSLARMAVVGGTMTGFVPGTIPPAKPGLPETPAIVAVNLASGTIGERHDLWELLEGKVRRHPDVPKQKLHADQLTSTPDGKYLLATMGPSLARFRISGTSLSLEEIGPPIGRGGQVVVSPDSKYVTVAAVGQHQPIADHPEARLPLYVYRVTDFSLPVVLLSVAEGLSPKQGSVAWPTLAFDPRKRQLLSGGINRPLAVFDSVGERTREYEFVGSLLRDAQPNRIEVHPAGGKYLVSFASPGVSAWLELP